MHNLEHILFITSVAVEKDEISKAELVDVLEALASASASTIQDRTNTVIGMAQEMPTKD